MAGRDPRHDILFEPVRIGPRTLPNRLYAVPHSVGMGTAKPYSQASFRGMRAEGGWGAVCTEYAPVSMDSDCAPSHAATMWDDGDRNNLAAMAAAAHEHGALAGIQLVHVGGFSLNNESRWPVVAPSQGSALSGASVPKTMDLADIHRVQADWVAAASRSRDADFDIIYLFAGLATQFLSPTLNKRSDQYGGSLRNRARFFLETLEGVREAVPDRAVAVRLGALGLAEAGVTLEDRIEFVRMADDMVDLWDINLDSILDPPAEAGPSRFYGPGYQFEQTAWIRDATDKPVVGVGRLVDPDVMADAVRSGHLDIVGAARAAIADPFLPAKVRDGRYSQIRECIGCNVCVRKAEYGGHIGCTQNATAGEEYRRGWHPEVFAPTTDPERAVLVVGAGPSGMECAITLAKRGFENVHVVEGGSSLGGHSRWAPLLPGLKSWSRVTDWRESELERLPNVTVIRNSPMTAESVLDYGAELVVVTTGSTWIDDTIPSIGDESDAGESIPLLTPEQVVRDGMRPPKGSVVVYDADGYYVGAGVAELLVGEGYEVTIVTPAPQVAMSTNMTGEGPRLRQHLHDLGIQFIRGASVSGRTSSGVVGATEFGDPIEIPCSSVIAVVGRQSDDAMYQELISDPARLVEAGIDAVYRVGDCVTPRLTADAIFDGHRLGREIDSPEPSVPLPYARERLLWTPA
ncbi:FAD-dependent oxidoreductase [Microbacterium sp. PMB16]|uniref:oxidoreductase n=1 Tax=Microbacterium sp. PMB16 TaxID=3120157 RepID=UPI003F4BEDFC